MTTRCSGHKKHVAALQREYRQHERKCFSMSACSEVAEAVAASSGGGTEYDGDFDTASAAEIKEANE